MDAAEGEVLVRGQTGVSGSIHKGSVKSYPRQVISFKNYSLKK